MTIPPTEKEPKPRRGLRVALAVAILLAGLAAGGYYLYVHVLGGQAHAHLHVPANANIVLRADGLRLLLFKPVRDHLWPVLLERRGEGDKDRRLRRIEEETGVKIPADVREVIVASVESTSWVMILGGVFDKGRFVPGLQKVLAEEELEGWALEGELLVHTLGPAIGQADDGTLVLGTNARVALAALEAADDAGPVPIAIDEAISFLVNQKAYKGALSQVPLNIPGRDALSKVEQLTGAMSLSEEPRIDIHIEPRQGVDPAALGDELDSALGKLRLAALLLPGDWAGGKRALSGAQVSAVEGGVRITAPWPYEPLDEAIGKLADALRTQPTTDDR